jgi:Sulfotransferase family
MLRKMQISVSIVQSIAKVQRHFQDYPPVFIIGSPRSGTTLTLKLFQNQPKITALFEPWQFWRKAFLDSKDDSYSIPSHPLLLPQFSYIYLKYLYFNEISANKPYLVSKDPRDSIRVETINKIFPNAKFIYLVRDGRDVISSTMKTFQNNLYRNGWYFDSDDWLHVRIPDYQNILSQPPHIRAAIQWHCCVETSLQHLEKIPEGRKLLFHYEDLISSPEEVTTKIFNFAFPELEINQQHLDKIINSISNQVVKNEQDEQDKSSKGQSQWSDKLKQFSSLVKDDAGSGTTAESQRVGRWKNEVNEEIIAEYYPLIEDLQKRLGYS